VGGSVKVGRVVVAALLGAVLVASGTASATAGRVAAAPLAAPMATVPFSGSGGVDGAGTGAPGDAARNAAVAAACNDGAPIGAPQWFRLPLAHGQGVLASVDAPYFDTGRGPSFNPSGVAITDATTGKVLSCGGSPTTLTRNRALAVVAFYRFVPGACDWSVEDCYWQDGALRLLVSPTSGAAPANDLQAAATPIGALPYTGTADLSLADADGDVTDFIDFDHCLLSAIDPGMTSTAWWRWTAPASGLMPRLAVDLGTAWPATSTPAPQVVVGLVGDDGVGLVPRQDPDPWNCESPQVVEAGRTYLIGVAVYDDDYYEANLHHGAPVTLRVGEVAAPGSPTQVAVTVPKPGRAQLAWQPPVAAGTSAVTGYRVVVDRRVAGGPWQTVSTVKLPASATAHTLRGLVPTEVYRLRVRALSAAGHGTPVDTLVATR
jgi:hypothetical protein